MMKYLGVAVNLLLDIILQCSVDHTFIYTYLRLTLWMSHPIDNKGLFFREILGNCVNDPDVPTTLLVNQTHRKMKYKAVYLIHHDLPMSLLYCIF